MNYRVTAGISAGFAVLGALLLSSAACLAQIAKTHDTRNSLSIVFKDGHQRSFSLADISRIEFKNSSIILIRSGRQESISLSDIVRIDFGNGASPVGRNHFLGKWKVGTGAGANFFITLEPDGQATKSIGATHGTWVVVDGEARISWDDGWHDVIRRVGSKHEKAAFEPGKSLDEEPSNVTDARNMSEQPI